MLSTRGKRARSTRELTYLFLAAGYAVFLAYGSLDPFGDWSSPDSGVVESTITVWSAQTDADIRVSLLVYLPLGLLLFNGIPRRWSLLLRLAVATAIGCVFSLGIEYLQGYLPIAVQSSRDVALNALGVLAGGVIAALLQPETRTGDYLRKRRAYLFRAGAPGTLALLVSLFWILAQLFPFLPPHDIEDIRNGIEPMRLTLSGAQSFRPIEAVAWACQIAALTLLLDMTLVSRDMPTRLRLIAGVVAVVTVLKIPALGHSVSLEAVVGLALGVLILSALVSVRRAQRAYLATLFLLVAYALMAVQRPLYSAVYGSGLNWSSFEGHLASALLGVGDWLGVVCLALALGLGTQLSYVTRPSHFAVVSGGLLVAAFVFAMEWLQQFIPGRDPDFRLMLPATAAWCIAWISPKLSVVQELPRRLMDGPENGRGPQPLVVAGVAAVFGASLAFGSLLVAPAQMIETRVDERRLPTHPVPTTLPPVALPRFRYAHPRLPSPSFSDMLRLERENPNFLARHKEAARNGRGNIRSAVIVAFFDPGSIDLAVLHKRLMVLDFEWRGHAQAKPLATAYDWLYHQWSEKERTQLQQKLIEGGNYLIGVIREQRLSPYNVFLYNSPLQALVAVSLAVYGDTAEADEIMRFTNDFWKNRTLPVWRQVMGTNGGWHEGGEYVGIGIGKAIYRVPAMWRAATGEDYFLEAGIQGFLDFLVYRTRPDGTHMRLGDGGFHRRAVPDRIPLAIELRHPAAYSLNGCPRRIEPTSWPWGPLPEESLCDPDAVKALPRAQHFDGIGLVVARSDWSSSATYLTFKAGDNYWSHSHLDQGSFTLYKGGALSIDSGVYAGYGSDHHLNYHYQTVAHNVVTVTDPADIVAKPQESGQGARTIANDGGQRRVGSGWGVEAAPVDLVEWQRKKEIYDTGSMLRVKTDPDLAVAVADLAAAYTNRFSGAGTFSHRTFRVAAFVRTLGFDPVDDVVVVHDRVKAAEPQFRKKWLLHTIERPRLEGPRFEVMIEPSKERARYGGRLEGTVLLPEGAHVHALGGPGFEFFVNGVNYTNDGAVWQFARTRPTVEPGAWRVIVSPPRAVAEDRFLVVLAPRLGGDAEAPAVRLLRAEGRYGCEVKGENRTTRWWFDGDHDGPVVEVMGEGRRRDLRVPRRSDVSPRSDLDRSVARLFGVWRASSE